MLPLDDDDHISDLVHVDDTFISGTFVPMVPKPAQSSRL